MTNLAKILKLYIAANDLEPTSVAGAMSISTITLARFLKGKNVDVATFMSILQWLTKESE